MDTKWWKWRHSNGRVVDCGVAAIQTGNLEFTTKWQETI